MEYFSTFPQRFCNTTPHPLYCTDHVSLYDFYGNPFVLKVTRCENADALFRNAVQECRFLEELRGTPGIVWLQDFQIDDRNHTVYLLEERLTPLADFLNRNSVLPSDIARIGTGICDSIKECLAAGILHRDISPGNLFFDGSSLKIGDFGCAVRLQDLKESDELFGTRMYMAPEAYTDHLYSEQSEIYSIGMILYWLLNFCNAPFCPGLSPDDALKKRTEGSPLPVPLYVLKFRPQLDPLWEIIKKACAFSCEDRYPSVRELRLDLASAGFDFFCQNQEPLRMALCTSDLEKTVMPPGFPLFSNSTERTDNPFIS
jgi:serine/threonine protein kinase